MSFFIDSITSLSATLSTNLSATVFFDSLSLNDKDNNTPWPIVEINIADSQKDYFGPPFLINHTLFIIYSKETTNTATSFEGLVEREDMRKDLWDAIQNWCLINSCGPLTNISSKTEILENNEYGSTPIARASTQFQIQIKDI